MSLPSVNRAAFVHDRERDVSAAIARLRAPAGPPNRQADSGQPEKERHEQEPLQVPTAGPAAHRGRPRHCQGRNCQQRTRERCSWSARPVRWDWRVVPATYGRARWHRRAYSRRHRNRRASAAGVATLARDRPVLTGAGVCRPA